VVNFKAGMEPIIGRIEPKIGRILLDSDFSFTNFVGVG